MWRNWSPAARSSEGTPGSSPWALPAASPSPPSRHLRQRSRRAAAVPLLSLYRHDDIVNAYVPWQRGGALGAEHPTRPGSRAVPAAETPSRCGSLPFSCGNSHFPLRSLLGRDGEDARGGPQKGPGSCENYTQEKTNKLNSMLLCSPLAPSPAPSGIVPLPPAADGKGAFPVRGEKETLSVSNRLYKEAL